MKMSTFNELMNEGGYAYSIGIIMYLDEALQSLQDAKQAKQLPDRCTKLKHEAADMQLEALQLAKEEKVSGKLFESMRNNYHPRDVLLINRILKKWQPILQNFGIEIQLV